MLQAVEELMLQVVVEQILRAVVEQVQQVVVGLELKAVGEMKVVQSAFHSLSQF